MTGHGLSPAALNGEAILRTLADAAPPTAPGAIAAQAGRPTKNIGRELAQLAGAGLIDADNRITAGGREAVDALDRAAGAGTLLRVRPELLFPNPMNPRKVFDPAALEGLADSTLDAGDFEQPLSVSPPDMLGHRFIWAGHRRWRAAQILVARAASGDAEAAATLIVTQGLACIEREADQAQSLFIAVVENGQREGLTALEDARALAALADATGWSGRELARRVGRAVEGSEKGVKDVQDKIRIARNATPDALAQYERDGSWDRLRASVRAEAGEAADEPQDMFPPEAGELRRADDEQPPAQAEDAYVRPRNVGLAIPPAGPVADEDQVIELGRAEQRVLWEVAHAVAHGKDCWSPDGDVSNRSDVTAVYAPAGKYWLDQLAATLQRLGLIDYRHHGRPYVRVTPRGWDWIRDAGDLAITARELERVRVEECRQTGRDAGDLDPSDATTYWTDWLNPQPVAEAPSVPGTAASDDEEDDGQAQIVLDQVRGALDAEAEGSPIRPETFAALLAATGTAPGWTASEADPGVVLDGQGQITCVVDVDNALPDAVAQARALAIAAAVNAACGFVPTGAGS